jgi:VWFA-related protein
MRLIRMSLVAVLSAGLAGALCAQVKLQDKTQETPPASTMKVNANLVVLTTVVRDRKGSLIPGLKKEDFTLTVGGKAQTIRYFDQDANQPLTLGLLVDVTRNMQDRLDAEKAASKAFLDVVLNKASAGHPPDKAFVVQFAKQIELLQDVTDDRAKLDASLKLLGTEDSTFHLGDDKDTVDSEGRKIRGGGTALYDAVYLSGQEIEARQTGRKVLVIITDGIDVGSKESLTEAIEAAQRTDTVVYAVYIRGQQKFDQTMGNPSRRSGYPGGGYPGGGYPGGGYPGGYPGRYPNPNDPNDPNNPNNPNNPNGSNKPGTPSRKPTVDGKQVLDRLCGETGGRVFEVTKKLPIEEIYQEISDEMKAAYRLGFTPDAAGARYGYHQIDLEMANPDDNKKDAIQVRSGYYAGGNE